MTDVDVLWLADLAVEVAARVGYAPALADATWVYLRHANVLAGCECALHVPERESDPWD